MLYRDIGYLCKEVEKLDSLRKPYKTFEKQEVFLNVKGVKRSEFYQANAQGYRPEICLELPACDYNGESHIEYDDVMYRVIRSYPVHNERVELTCQSLVSDD